MRRAAKVPVSVLVPMRLVSALNTREHWAVKGKRNKTQGGAVVAALDAYSRLRAVCGHEPQRPPYRVHLVRIGKRTLDGDNLQGAFKAIRDAVAAWLSIDDGDPRIEWVYAQEKGDYAVRVSVFST